MGKIICVEGYKAFTGVMKIAPKTAKVRLLNWRESGCINLSMVAGMEKEAHSAKKFVRL